MAWTLATRQNCRPHMEDVVCVHRDLRSLAPFPCSVESWLQHCDVPAGAPVTLAIIVDGHGGDAAAKFTVERLPALIATILTTSGDEAWTRVQHIIEGSEDACCASGETGTAPPHGDIGYAMTPPHMMSSPFTGSSATASPPDRSEIATRAYAGFSSRDDADLPVAPSHFRSRCVSQDAASFRRTPGHFRESARSVDAPSMLAAALAADTSTEDLEPTLEAVIPSVLSRAIAQLDAEYCTSARASRAADGACVNMALIVGRHLFVGNVGDSRAALIDGECATPLSQDHKPNVTVEMDRIVACGGSVKFASGEYRVFPARIAVSRTIGDVRWKDRRLLISKCDVTCTHLQGHSRWLVLASDGVWGKLSPANIQELLSSCAITAASSNIETAPQERRNCCGFRPKDVKRAPFQSLLSEGVTLEATCHPADVIADAAVAHGSTDNISVVVIALQPLLAWLDAQA